MVPAEGLHRNEKAFGVHAANCRQNTATRQSYSASSVPLANDVELPISSPPNLDRTHTPCFALRQGSRQRLSLQTENA